MLKALGIKPSVMQAQLHEQVVASRVASDANECLAALGLRMRQTPLAVWGRKFPAPLLLMPEQPRDRLLSIEPSKRGSLGEWFPGKAFAKIGRENIDKVIVLDASDGDGGRKIDEYARALCDQLRQRGITMGEPRFAKLGRGRCSLRDVDEAIKAAAGGQKPDLVIPVIPKTIAQVNASLYGAIKAWGDLDNGIVTSCVTTDLLKKAKNLGQIAGSIAAKINAKFGGVNRVVVDGGEQQRPVAVTIFERFRLGKR